MNVSKGFHKAVYCSNWLACEIRLLKATGQTANCPGNHANHTYNTEYVFYYIVLDIGIRPFFDILAFLLDDGPENSIINHLQFILVCLQTQ